MASGQCTRLWQMPLLRLIGADLMDTVIIVSFAVAFVFFIRYMMLYNHDERA